MENDTKNLMINLSFKLSDFNRIETVILILCSFVGVSDLKDGAISECKIFESNKGTLLTMGMYPNKTPPPFPEPFRILLGRNPGCKIMGCIFTVVDTLLLSSQRCRGRKQ